LSVAITAGSRKPSPGVPIYAYGIDDIHKAAKRDNWWWTCETFAHMFAADNSRFDRERFLTWCSEERK